MSRSPYRSLEAPNRGWPRSKRPQGQPTRGKTAANRLRRVDSFMLLYDPHVIRRQDGAFADAWFVDLGYGAEPITTLESAARVRALNPHVRVLGVEIDPARVAAAQPFADSMTQFRLGGFNLPMQRLDDGRSEMARAIRAFNVLRQYDPSAVETAYTELAVHALPGALLVEGTSNPSGSLWVANVLRRNRMAVTWDAEALVFSAKLQSPFDPAEFQAVLPKNLIHRMQPGEWIYSLIEGWKLAARRTSSERVWGERRWFAAAANDLCEAGFAVDTRRRWLNRGYLVVDRRVCVECTNVQ